MRLIGGKYCLMMEIQLFGNSEQLNGRKKPRRIIFCWFSQEPFFLQKFSYHECNTYFNHKGVDILKHKRDNRIMDTQKITSDLLSTGLTQKALSELVPCSQSLISALLRGERGVRLTYKIGSRLNELHGDRCKSKELQCDT